MTWLTVLKKSSATCSCIFSIHFSIILQRNSAQN